MIKDETQPAILPYSYRKVSDNTVLIVHPAGARIRKNRFEIERRLDGTEINLRPLSKHERVMFEEALKVFNEQ